MGLADAVGGGDAPAREQGADALGAERLGVEVPLCHLAAQDRQPPCLLARLDALADRGQAAGAAQCQHAFGNGDIVVAETAARRLSVIDLKSGERETIAEDLPIGLPAGPGMPPSGITTGVAVDADGVIYFGSDIDNGLYKIEPVIVEPDRAIAEKP